MQFPFDIIPIVKLLIIGEGILVNISHDLTQFNFFTLQVTVEMDWLESLEIAKLFCLQFTSLIEFWNENLFFKVKQKFFCPSLSNIPGTTQFSFRLYQSHNRMFQFRSDCAGSGPLWCIHLRPNVRRMNFWRSRSPNRCRCHSQQEVLRG